VLILYGEGEISRDASRLRAARSLNAMGERRFGVELLPTDAMAGFDQMPPASQELVLDRVVGWLEETLAARGGAPQPTTAAARAAVLV
jgi:hypothetical protein